MIQIILKQIKRHKNILIYYILLLAPTNEIMKATKKLNKMKNRGVKSLLVKEKDLIRSITKKSDIYDEYNQI